MSNPTNSLEALLSGPLKSIYTPVISFLTPTVAHAMINPPHNTGWDPAEFPQRRQMPHYMAPDHLKYPDHVTPDHHDRLLPGTLDHPTHFDLVDLYNDLSYRGIAEPYDHMDSHIHQQTHCPDGQWGISATTNILKPDRRIQLSSGLNLNRTKQHQTPLNWYNGAVFATEDCHVIGHFDLDTAGIKCYAANDFITYQGSEMTSFSGDEDSSAHQITLFPLNSLTLGYEYQAHPQAIEQTFTATTKLDTIGVGVKTSYLLGNLIVTGKLSKRFYLFDQLPFHQNPLNYLMYGDDVTIELQEADKTLNRTEVQTSATISSTGELGMNVASRVGWKAIRECAVTAKVALAQGMLDFQAMLGFFVFGRRVRLYLDQDGSLQFNSRFAFGDGSWQANVNFECNPIDMVYSAQVPTISAQLNTNINLSDYLSGI